jgi:hypothetical protein
MGSEQEGTQMRKSTALVLAATGAILLLAVNVPLPYLSLQVVGLILLVTGLVGLQLPQLVTGWLQRHHGRMIEVLDPAADEPDLPRVPLDTLLDPAAGAGQAMTARRAPARGTTTAQAYSPGRHAGPG